MSDAYDWSEPALQKAAVEYALGQCGASPEKGTAWLARVKECAKSLRVPWRDLARWMHDKDNRPDYIQPDTAGMDDESVISMTAAPENVVSDLMAAEEDTLSDAERMALADHIESGSLISHGQRETLVKLLRGSAFATRADVFGRLLQFLLESSIRTTWETRSSWLSVPAGGSWEHVDAPYPVKAGKVFSLASRTIIIVRGFQGEVVAVRLYARAESRRISNNSLKYTQLIPCRQFSRDLIARKLAILHSMVTPTGHDGKRLSMETGDSKALVSYHRKAMAERVAIATGGRGVFPGLRRPQANRGEARMRKQQEGEPTATSHNQSQLRAS